MLYRKQTMATPTKNSTEEAESPTRCVVVTERLQSVALPTMSGTWLNLGGRHKAEGSDRSWPFYLMVFLKSID